MSLYDAYVIADRTLRDLEAIVDSIQPTDWPQVIRECGESGISVRRIALLLVVSQPTVQGWQHGSIPNFESGRKLLAIHAARNSCRVTDGRGV